MSNALACRKFLGSAGAAAALLGWSALFCGSLRNAHPFANGASNSRSTSDRIVDKRLRRFWGIPRRRSRARLTCTPSRKSSLAQLRAWRGLYLDPNWTQVWSPTLKCQRQFIENKEVSGRGAEI